MRFALTAYALVFAALCGFASGPVAAQGAKAPPPTGVDLAAFSAERSLGKADAPVTIIEYASLTCSHCADFYKNVFPQLEKDYIQTGKVRLIYRDFPTNEPAVEAAAMARCASPMRYFPLLKAIYDKQNQVIAAAQRAGREGWRRELALIGMTAGLPPDLANACLSNETLLNEVIAGTVKAQSQWNITGTPTFILNDGKARLAGATYDEFKRTIDRLLK
jgi:protein-disulfide isomerase